MGFLRCLREIVHGLDGVGCCGSLGKGDHGGIHASVALVLGCRVSIRGWCCMMCIIRRENGVDEYLGVRWNASQWRIRDVLRVGQTVVNTVQSIRGSQGLT